jgi:serine/threonine protein kinase
MERRDLDVPSDTYRTHGMSASRSDRASIGAEPAEDPLLGLLERWQERYVRNEDPTPEELGVEDPVLRESLRQQIRDYKRLFDLLGLPLDPSQEETANLGHAVGPTGAGPVNQTVAGSVPRIGRYQILGTLGRGGQADVFRVLHPELSKEFVLKLSRRSAAVDPDDRERMLREGQLLAGCDHPNLVRVVDLDFHEGRPFVVMEHVHGLNLEQFAEQHRPPPSEIARLVAGLCRAVTYIHRRGIVHLDIKPKNVLIDEAGRPRLIDFGLARFRHVWTGDPDGSSGGTTCYMSPEQANGDADRIGPWTDVFGLGGVLYYLLTGRPVYQGDRGLGAFEQASKGEQVAPRRVNPRVPRGLEPICLKALAADPERRYRAADDLGRPLRRYRRRPWMVAAGAVVLGLAALASVSFLSMPAPAPHIVSLEVKHIRGEPPQMLGTVGDTPGPMLFEDDVKVHARLDTPVYCYLIALNPDGKDQLCLPSKATDPPPRSDRMVYPPESEKYFPLTDGVGLQVFLLVASKKPLPAYAEWKDRVGLRWESIRADDAGVWGFDGRTFELLSGGRRGAPRERSGPSRPFQELCQSVAKLPGIDAVRAIAFPVVEAR